MREIGGIDNDNVVMILENKFTSERQRTAIDKQCNHVMEKMLRKNKRLARHEL